MQVATYVAALLVESGLVIEAPVGNKGLALNVLAVPVHVFADAMRPYAPSPYVLVISCVPDEGVSEEVGRELLKVVVPVNVLLFDHEFVPVQALLLERDA